MISVADTEPNPRFPLYTRGNTGEVFPHAMSPLTGTLIGPDVERAQAEMFVAMGAISRREAAGAPVGTGVFAGYLYGNGSLARLIGVRTPGMTAQSADHEVFGAVADVPPYRPRTGDRSLAASARLTWYLLRLLREPDLSALDAARADATAWLATMPPLDTATDGELLAFLSGYPGRLGTSMRRLLEWSMLGVTRVLVDRLLEGTGAEPGLTTRLVAGVDDVDSAQPGIELWGLGRIVAADPRLGAAFDEGLDGVAERIATTALDAPLASFLARRGHRGNDEYELATPCWAQDPSPVLAAIDRLRMAPADRDPAWAARRLARERAEADARLATLLRGPKLRFARRALRIARAGAVARERAKDILVLESYGARLVIAELARRAAGRGGPDDLGRFCCVTWSELPAMLADPPSFAATIEQRWVLQQYLDEREPPPWFEGVIPHPSTWPLRATTARGGVPRGTVHGIPVSAGRAVGRARIVSDPGDPCGLEPGEVLVCRITDPSWTPLFLVAAAVVCDSGAMLSHAAIVARELGVPAVMSAHGITAIPDGTWLEVDGDAGTVTIGYPCEQGAEPQPGVG